MQTQMEFGVGHLQNVEVVGVFHSLFTAPVPVSGIGVGRMDFASRKEGKKLLWFKVWYSFSEDVISMVDTGGLWHRIWLKFKLKLEKYLCDCLVGRSDKAKMKGDHKSCRKIGPRARMWGLIRNCKKLRKNPFPKNTATREVQGSMFLQSFSKTTQGNLHVGKGCCLVQSLC